jgi:GWxTD domain-containing protein
MKKCFLLLALALAMACGIELFAQTLTPTSNFVLNVDYARFRNDDQSGYLEVYYGFYPNLLTYRLSNGVYHAGVKLHTRLRNKATHAVAVTQQALLPLAITDTSSASYRFPFITQTGHVVPFGEYTLEVLAVDSLNASRRDSISLPLKFQRYPDTLSLSDVELCSKVAASNQKNDPFFKNSLEVVPSAALVFGVATHPMLFNYVELYNLDPDATYTAKRQLVASDGKVVKESSQPRQYGMRNGVEAGSMNVTAVMPGKYAFRLLLLDERGREVGRSEKTFFVYNPHLQAPASTPAVSPFQATQLAGLSDAELTKEFQQAQYLATSDEAKMFAQLTSETGKREFLANLWSQVELGRFDRAPIKRAEYLRRVAVANQNFTVLGREGWRTDRGRIYLLYGDPDQIDRFPGETESKPYQIWRYFGIERGVEFIFIDRWGDSNYHLVHSTKRGELQDDAWQRFLQ